MPQGAVFRCNEIVNINPSARIFSRVHDQRDVDSARENIKWPFVKPTFVVHGRQSALRFLSGSSSLLIIPCQATTSQDVDLTS